MPFVKLDCGILKSTLWFDRDAREVFITALLMAEPAELTEPEPQIAIGSLDYTGWMIPPGWYGFVAAAGVGIIRSAGIERAEGMEALARLGRPEDSSRSRDFDGRRLVRIDGGFIVLNFMKYRERDYTAAERSRRYRERVASRRDRAPSRRDITQAEEEAEAEVKQKTDSSADAASVLAYWQEKTSTKLRSSKAKEQTVARIRARLRDGCSPADLRACVDFAQADEFYAGKGYAKQPDVIWRSAARVSDLANRMERAPSAAGTTEHRGPTPEELARLDAEADARLAR